MIRPARATDLDSLYGICLLTGDAGGDATPLLADPDLPGRVFAGPYAVHQPDLAFVVEDDAGVGGYVLGAFDTDDFHRRLEERWWPTLRQRYPLAATGGRTPADDLLVHLVHHPLEGDPGLVATHPSHLHIDLLPRCQGSGDGRRLMGTLLDELRRRGAPGVHLGVERRNRRAIGFYRHLGFSDLGRDEHHLTLGLALA